ncbi:MAG: TOBE domain-containing protein [Candidatus Devosia euplotis]|nr:TOBE domain-containing protein [Candidatus Devosia euplotis]
MGHAIVCDSKVFLFDEPLSNLDAKLRVQMRGEIKGLDQRLSTTIVYVTHNQIEAMTMADKIVVMNAGQVEEMSAPLELYDRPANVFVSGFLGSPAMNFLSGKLGPSNTLLPANGETVATRAFDANLVGRDVVFGVRPEHIFLAARDDTAAQVTTIEPTGSETHLSVRLGGQGLVFVMSDRLDIGVGQTV